MVFNYQATSREGQMQSGTIEAPTIDTAITSLQRRGLIIISVTPVGGEKFAWFRKLPFLSQVKNKEVVILSRQIATLFEAKVSVLAAFKLLASESANSFLAAKLSQVTDDISGGLPISSALTKHPDVFSDFYISMVKSGEESGKLSEAFNFLAEYLERSFVLSSRAKNALIYPAFVVITFVAVIILMLVFVIPQLQTILVETGQPIPIYTQIILDISNFFVNYGLLLVILIIVLAIFMVRYLPTKVGRESLSRFKIGIPYVGRLYRKLYLARLADNLNTLLAAGISMVRALEITADVVGNTIYKNILLEAATAIKAGSSVSNELAKYPEMPGIMIQMIKVGEETGKMAFTLETMARFYNREVQSEVDTLVNLIEPVMIVVLGLGVGVLLAAVLLPIYNVASSL